MPISKTKLWWRAVASAAITGFSTSLLTVLGVNGAEVVGVKIEQLDIKQATMIAVVGGVVGVVAYLKQSPLPPIDDENLN